MTPSPALLKQSDIYPADWCGKVPKRVRLIETVQAEMLPGENMPCVKLYSGTTYYVWVNSHGAVAAILKNGEMLGLKPDEFEVIEWHKEKTS